MTQPRSRDATPTARAPVGPRASVRGRFGRWFAVGGVVGALGLGVVAMVGAWFTSSTTSSQVVSSASCFYVPTVQSGSTVVAATGTTSVAIGTVDPTHAFLLFSSSADGSRPTAGLIGGRISSATTLDFVRVTDGVAPEPVPVVVSWTVVEYPCGVSVQRGTASVSATTTDVAITSVGAVGQAFATVSETGGAAEQTWIADGDDLLSAQLTSTTNLRLQAAVAPSVTHTAYWQVVTFTDQTMINVQSGATTLGVGTASATATLSTSASTGSSFVLASVRAGVSGGTSDAASGLVQAQLTSTTQVSFASSASNYAATVQWQVVTLNDGTVAQSGTASMNTGVTTATGALTTSVVVNRVSAFAATATPGGQSAGQTAYASDDNTGVGTATFEVTGPSTVTLTRRNSTAASTFAWQVVDWGRRVTTPASAAVPSAPGTLRRNAFSPPRVMGSASLKAQSHGRWNAPITFHAST